MLPLADRVKVHLAFSPSLVRKMINFISKQIPQIRCLTPSKVAASGTKQNSQDLNYLILFTFHSHSQRLMYLYILWCVVSEKGYSVKQFLVRRRKNLYEGNVLMLFPYGTSLQLSHPHQNTYRHAEPQPKEKKIHLFFSLKVKAGFIQSLGNKEFAALLLDISTASASLLPKRQNPGGIQLNEKKKK